MKLSIVIPAYNEERALPTLIERLDAMLPQIDSECEVIFVDDGSEDGTWEIVSGQAQRDPRYSAIRLSRNFGHQAALSAGLATAGGDAVITMDADLQHPPEFVPKLFAKGREGFDVVYAVRVQTDSEGWFKVKSARLFYWFFNKLTSLNMPTGGAADFRYASRRMVDALMAMPERARFLRGMTRWVGFRQTSIEFERASREAGESKYTLRRMLRFALHAIVSFSAIPLRIASIMGFIVSLAGGLYLIWIVALRLFTSEIPPNWASVIAIVLLLGGAQLVCLGIIGQYLSRVFDEVKARPLFFIAEDTRLPNGAASPAAERTVGLTAWPDPAGR